MKMEGYWGHVLHTTLDGVAPESQVEPYDILGPSQEISSFPKEMERHMTCLATVLARRDSNTELIHIRRQVRYRPRLRILPDMGLIQRFPSSRALVAISAQAESSRLFSSDYFVLRRGRVGRVLPQSASLSCSACVRPLRQAAPNIIRKNSRPESGSH